MSSRIFVLLVATAALASGCASNAPRYTTNYAGVAELKAANLAAVKIGDITKPAKAKPDVDALTIRGGAYRSPYGSFVAYLKEALKDDFDHAELLDESSTVQIEGVLLRNVLDGSGASLGFAEIEAKLAVRREGRVVYERSKFIRHEWPSNFIGAVAIPRAMTNYPFAVRRLLLEFYADPEFLAALKKR